MLKTLTLKIGIIFVLAFTLNSCRSDGARSAEITRDPAAAEPSLPERVPANETIRFLEARVKSDPEDFIAYNKLASEYLLQMRQTGDISYLDLALNAANRSLEILPAEQNKGGLSALARAEFSSHRFQSSLDHASRLLAIDPGKAYVYQLLGDAQLELGRYDEAIASIKKMDELSPAKGVGRVPVEQRLSKIAFLYGDNKKARFHMSNAVRLAESSPGTPAETIAWCKWQLGELAFAENDLTAAEENFNSSLKALPGYFAATEALGHLTAARGDLNKAVEIYERSASGSGAVSADPMTTVMLADLYKLAGRQADADAQYAAFERIASRDAANGNLHVRISSMFYANHDINATQACDAAAKEYETRKDIYGADILAWACFKAGRLDIAQPAIKDALRLGTKDAQLFYHAGMIEKAVGNNAEARKFIALSLKTNPYFDLLQAENARRVLAELQ